MKKLLELLVLLFTLSFFLPTTYFLIENWIIEGTAKLILNFEKYNEHYVEIPIMIFTCGGLIWISLKRIFEK